MDTRADLADITTLSFDGDGTLWDFLGAMRAALEQVLVEISRLVPGERASHLTVGDLITIRDGVAADWQGRGARLEDIRLEAFRRTLEQLGVQDEALAIHLHALYMERRFAGIVLFEDVLPALHTLARWYRLGLLSNGNTYPERCGLAGQFQFVLLAQECGYAKPDPRIFACALERAGCSPGQLLHVGDSLTDDVQGAQQVGIRAVWLNRFEKCNETAIRPDAEVSTLGELVAWLEGGNSAGLSRSETAG